jgi:ABC-type spermidine/putrescine transport system permease subunit I
MAGALVASQFLQAQNKALGSAVAVVLIVSILVCITVGAVVGLIGRSLLKRRRAVAPVVPELAVA